MDEPQAPSTPSTAPASIPQPSSASVDRNALRRIVGNLIQVQVGVRDIAAFFNSIAQTESIADAEVRKGRIRELVTDNAVYIRAQCERAAEAMGNVYALHADPTVTPERGDLSRVENAWERVKAADMSQYFAKPDSLTVPLARGFVIACGALQREIGRFTIPKEIGSLMRAKSGVGAPLDFHEAFKDWLEDPADRAAVLRGLVETNPDLVGGMVDVERGMIYRIGNRRRRFVSYALILGTAVLGGAALLVLVLSTSPLLNLLGLTVDDAKPFSHPLLLYGLTALGVMAHVVKKASELSLTEQGKGVDQGSQVVLDRLMFWIHVREYRFLTSVLAAMAAFVLLAIAGQLDPLKAFLAGYTVDSFSDLLLQRFNTAVSSYETEVKQAMSLKTVP